MISSELTAVARFPEQSDEERWPLLLTCLFVVSSSALLWTVIIGGVRLLIV